MKAPAGKGFGNRSRTGPVALLRSFLGGKGSGAPSHRRAGFALAAFLALTALVVIAAPFASGAAPTVTIEAVSQVRFTTATAKGTVDPSNHQTTYFFQYATEADFSNAETAGEGTLAEGLGSTPVEAELSGLHPATTYHLRLVAENVEGEREEATAGTTFTTEAVAAPSVSLEPVTTVGSTNVQFVGHVNPNAPNAIGSTDAAEEAAFRTEYRFVCSPACPGLTGATGTVAADDTAHEVTAESTELPAGSRSYEVKVVASNAGGETSAGPIPFTTSSAAPTIESSSASAGVREAEFRATIDPGNLATTYRFEYGPTAAYTRSTETQTISPSASPAAVTAKVSGLEPSSTYHFRVVAQNAKGPAVSVDQEIGTSSESAAQSCPNEQLRSENHSLLLPDCRAYELVTPVSKNGQPPVTNQTDVDPAGDITFTSIGAFNNPGNSSTAAGGEYVANRDEGGWTATAVNPSGEAFRAGSPELESSSHETLDFNAALDETLFLKAPIGAKPIDTRFYVRRASTGATEEVGPLLPPETVAAWNAGVAEESNNPPVVYAGASRDLSDVLFSNGVRVPESLSWFWPGDHTFLQSGRRSVYEYAGRGMREPELVGVENEGTVAATAAAEGKAHINEAAEQVSECGIAIGGYQPSSGLSVDTYNAVSASGGTVFFTALSNACETGEKGPEVASLYARLSRERTVAISEPTNGPGGDCPACDESEEHAALFQGASEDGSKAFFLSEQRLFSGADGESGVNLYEYDFDAPAHQKVSLIGSNLPLSEGQASGVLRVSADGSAVYFVSHDVLATNVGADGSTAEAGEEDFNLYLAETASDKKTFIAGLSASDAQDWQTVDQSRHTEATPDGRFLIFPSRVGLTPDSSGSSNQLYRYVAPTPAHPVGALARVSIGHDGFNGDGNDAANEFPFSPDYQRNGERSYLSSTSAAPASVGITSDGSRVFFESPAALVPGALDDLCAREREGECIAAVDNVYEWDEGQISLISDGRDASAFLGGSSTRLVGADPDGKNVFFVTASALVPADTDTQADLYDARREGGFPQPPPPSACAGEGCQGAVTPAPAVTPSGSSSFSGPGNPSPQAKKHKKHHKKKHHKKKHKKQAQGKNGDRHRSSLNHRSGAGK
jgi:hypothetical protein